MVLLVLIGIAVVVGLYLMATYNSLIGLRNKVEEAFSTMDVYLKKRFDLIPNLVATVKGYAKHEAETLEKVIAMRSGAANPGEQLEAEKQITSAIRNIMVTVERYPDLKANQNFLDLQSQLKTIEEDIANSRRYYNGSVRQYNDKVMMFPGNIVAGFFHFEKKPMYEVDDAEERKNVKVSFE